MEQEQSTPDEDAAMHLRQAIARAAQEGLAMATVKRVMLALDPPIAPTEIEEFDLEAFRRNQQ